MEYFAHFNFLGKDSVPYDKEFEISEDIYNTIQELEKGKTDNESIFNVDSNDVNQFIKEAFSQGSAKLFRTAIGTQTAVRVLKQQNLSKDATLAQKLKAFNNASIEISKLLNHQKNIAKNNDEKIAKTKESALKAKEREKEIKEKAKADLLKIKNTIEASKQVLKGDKLKEKLKSLKEKEAKIKEKLAKAKERVDLTADKLDFQKKTGDIALNTAKNSYFSPKVVVSWAKYYDVPIEKIYSKSMIAKFDWAMNVDENYWLDYPTD